MLNSFLLDIEMDFLIHKNGNILEIPFFDEIQSFGEYFTTHSSSVEFKAILCERLYSTAIRYIGFWTKLIYTGCIGNCNA